VVRDRDATVALTRRLKRDERLLCRHEPSGNFTPVIQGRITMRLMLATIFLASSIFRVAAAVSPNDPLPTTVLNCGGSIIKSITGRLEGDHNFETGAEVGVGNGGGSVAYQDDPSIAAIRKSKVGDHVLMCLVYVPNHCPKGDVRGKFYTVTNLRTLESWTLPDSEHSCGGA
jgi:hypothetical protein